MSDRVILHCDCNSFFASVEQVLNPKLAHVPMAVAGDPTKRQGIILAKNELAKKYGVVTPEAIWQAKKKCPALVCVAPHYDKYVEFSNKCNEIYNRFTDLIEPFGIDESWLDVTASRELFGDGEQIANTLRRMIKTELGITISVGVSFNKIFAKLGSDYKKPDATTVITREHGKKIVFPLPVESLLFVGKKASSALKKLNIHTIGQLAKFNRDILVDRLGALGGMIHDYANGRDDSPVMPYGYRADEKSIGKGETFVRDVSSFKELRPKVQRIADRVGLRMRNKGFKALTLAVAIKDSEFKTIRRQIKLDVPTNLTLEITRLAMEIIESNWREGRAIRSITITGNNLVKADKVVEQMSFFGEDKARLRDERLQEVVDELNKKLGRGAVAFGEEKRLNNE
ncbi:MAG: DNA polymerase IV [Clostridiales bacterium]|jgi:DNA polymerase-4|nr:DNA polymerase IV [Clostridiales bacterium]